MVPARKALTSLLAAFAAMLVVAGCGGDDNKDSGAKLDDPNPDNTAFHVAAEANRFGGPAPLTVKFFTTPFHADGPVHYRWRFDDGSPPSEEESPVHTFPKPGYYQVLLDARDAKGHDAWNLIVGVWPAKLWEASQKSSQAPTARSIKAFQRQQGRRTGVRRRATLRQSKKRAERYSGLGAEGPGT